MRTFMRTRITTIAAALAVAGTSTAAFALTNPLVAQINAIGPNGAHGNATFFQLAESVNVGINLSSDPSGRQALDLRKGTCKSYAGSTRWPLGSFDGTSDQRRLPNTKLESILGNVLLIHKTPNDASPVIGCAEIKG